MQFAFYVGGAALWLLASLFGRPAVALMREAASPSADGLAMLAASQALLPDLIIAGFAAVCGTLLVGFGGVIETLRKRA